MTKGFLKNNPNAVLAGIHKEPDPTEPNAHKADESKLQETASMQGKKKPEYLRLDITNYKDYVSLMAGHLTSTSGKYVSMTQYILGLIEADKQSNIDLYRKLEQIENMKRDLI